MASIFSKRIAALCAAALVSATANAAATYTTEDNGATLVVEVDSVGATMDATQVGAGITKIKKTGPGTLTAVPLSTYTGDFSIEEGVYSYDVVGDFGVTNDNGGAGVIDIKENAKILHRQNTSSPSAAQRYVLSGKTINLYGGTVPNMETSTKAYPIYMGKNMTIVLKADASIKQNTGGRPSYRGTIDLCGYTLTLEGSGQIDLAGNVLNGGKISVGSGALMTDNGLVFDPDHKGIVDIPSGRACYLNNVTANGWTIECVNGAIYANKSITGDDIYNGFTAWDGPIVISNSSKIAPYSGYGTTAVKTVLNVKGSVSGSGKLQVGPGWLNLRNEENTYSGAVTVTGSGSLFSDFGGLGVYNDAPCFPDASSLVFTNGARFGFMDNVATSVRGLTFVGERTQSIFGGDPASRPAIAGIVKKDEGVLEVDSPVHVTGTTKVDGGTLKIPFRSFYGTPGLFETYLTPKVYSGSDWTDRNYIFALSDTTFRMGKPWADNISAHVDFSEKGVCGVGAQRAYKGLINASNIGWDDGWSATHAGTRTGWWYRGYVWNHSDEPVTFTIWHGFQNPLAIWLGEDHATEIDFPVGATFSQNGIIVTDAREVTIQPGATQIDIFVTSSGKDLWSVSLPDNAERHGLVFAPTSTCTAAALNSQLAAFYKEASAETTNATRALLRQFSEFKDTSGRGLLFTTNVYGENDDDKITEQQPVFDNIEFAYGAKFDLAGNSLFNAKNITGSPIVTNAVVLKITNNWTICAADFPKADSSVRHPMTVDGKLVFAEGATFSVDDENAIERSQSGIVVATATGGIVGKPEAVSGLAKKWKLRIDGNVAKLIDSSGLNVVLR